MLTECISAVFYHWYIATVYEHRFDPKINPQFTDHCSPKFKYPYSHIINQKHVLSIVKLHLFSVLNHNLRVQIEVSYC